MGIITLPVSPNLSRINSDWFNLEVERYQAENKRLQILNEIVKDSKAFGVG
jgi:hypothetical protein